MPQEHDAQSTWSSDFARGAETSDMKDNMRQAQEKVKHPAPRSLFDALLQFGATQQS